MKAQKGLPRVHEYELREASTREKVLFCKSKYHIRIVLGAQYDIEA